jgi:hypothetical protein
VTLEARVDQRKPDHVICRSGGERETDPRCSCRGRGSAGLDYLILSPKRRLASLLALSDLACPFLGADGVLAACYCRCGRSSELIAKTEYPKPVEPQGLASFIMVPMGAAT